MALALITGIGLGLAVAMQVGPISLLCIRSVLRGSWAAGIGIAGGAALIDALYAALGTAGAASLLQIGPLHLVLGPGRRARAGHHRVPHAVDRVPRATAASTPTRCAARAGRSRSRSRRPPRTRSTIVSWAAVFSAASTARVADTPGTAGALLLGVALGTFTWFSGLSTGPGADPHPGRHGLREVVDAAAGAGLIGFGALLGCAPPTTRKETGAAAAGTLPACGSSP